MAYLFMILGVGGTGSLLARDLPKLLMHTDHRMILFDGDEVEAKNQKRQAYQSQDIGENKAISLAKKINTFYDIQCEARDAYITQNELIEETKRYPGFTPVMIGCVDNDKTRVLIENNFNQMGEVVYIDSANSEYDGNVYIAAKSQGIQSGAVRGAVYKLQDDIHPTEKSCQEQTAKGNTQYLVTNLKMASILLEHISSLLSKDLRTGVTHVQRFEEIHYQ